ncbi:MAG: hypothetical protein QNJ55_30045, partial [Xenococcus sp. MO_188.B8]|nr:hypothetical protein [Xenococcus sp. MO_188.B8]
GSYFVSSCGGVTIETLKKYLETQDRLNTKIHPATKVGDFFWQNVKLVLSSSTISPLIFSLSLLVNVQ